MLDLNLYISTFTVGPWLYLADDFGSPYNQIDHNGHVLCNNTGNLFTTAAKPPHVVLKIDFLFSS